jgi:hypothetical protein
VYAVAVEGGALLFDVVEVDWEDKVVKHDSIIIPPKYRMTIFIYH